MKFSRMTALLAVSMLTLAACKKETTELADAGGNPLLAHVPADTPYLFANIEPTPVEVVDSFIARMGPALQTAQELLDDFELEVTGDAGDDYREARLVSAILDELDGKLNREGLESLGLSLESHKVVYGVGMFPVMRVALKDADALRAAIGRIETASGMEFESRSVDGADYWKIQDRGRKIGLYFAILDAQFAVGVHPLAEEAQWLPAFLGQALPADPAAIARSLADLNREKGYSDFGSGYFDLQAAAAELLDENGRTGRLLKAMGEGAPAPLSPVCVSEIKGLVAKAPRITGGTTELTTGAVAMSYTLELEPGLAGKLAGLVADVAPASKDPAKVLSAALGLNVGRLRDFMLERATAITAAPFQCDKLQAFNDQARQALDQLNQPMPPFINNLKGFRVSLDEIDFENPDPKNIRGLFSLEVEKPQMLIGMAQMFVPGLEGLELEPGADPVEVPQELLTFASGGMQIHAVMDRDSLGFSLGDGGPDALAAFMDEPGAGSGILFSMEYDMTAPLNFQPVTGPNAAGEGGAHGRDLVRELREAYMSWLGRSRVEVGFTAEGVQVDTRMTFKE